MYSRNQAFSDRASAFWGHHRLLSEQLAGVSGWRQLSFERSNAFVGGGYLVGLHTEDRSTAPASVSARRFHRNSVA
jgi:hypothetical protein